MSITGKGASPIVSMWVVVGLHKKAKESDRDTADTTAVNDWFFPAAVAPPEGTPVRTLFGVGK